MFLSDNTGDQTKNLREAWDVVINHEDYDKIEDRTKRDTVVRLLENMKKEKVGLQSQDLQEVAANATGANIDNYDPILISLVRRAVPNLIAFDTVGVQPMNGPTGLIFAIKSHYTNQTGTEAGGQSEYDTDFSGAGTHVTTDGTNNPFEGTWTTGTGMTTSAAEALGNTGNAFGEMAFSIEKSSVEAQTRALKAKYTMELAQDLRAIHGLDAEAELSSILSTEIMGEINREIIRTLLSIAKPGAQKDTDVAGEFNLNGDASGRWNVEKYKGLMMAIERDANAVARETRRGRANWIICSSDVASALSMAGKLETLSKGESMNVNDTGNTFVGVLNGKYKVFIDPYWTVSDMEFYMVGYKGANVFDAGMFYTPYVPLQMMKAVGEEDFQPRIGFKTRYGIVANPFASLTANTNPYYRKVVVKNIL